MHLRSMLLVALSLLPSCSTPGGDSKPKQAGRSLKVRRFIAHAYCSGQVTALGRKPVAGRTIAADPRVLPLGSHVLVTNAGKYSGEYHVGDVGDKVKGRMVDVFVNNLKEAQEFGRKQIHLTVLHVPRVRPKYGVHSDCSRCNQRKIGRSGLLAGLPNLAAPAY